jgi:hypothetical protein
MAFTDIVRQAGNVQGVIGSVVNFTQSVLSLFGVDIVGIYDNDTFDQLFETARPIRANIKREIKVMQHPIETGALVQDFMIVQPVEIELSLMLASDGEYQTVYQAIKQYHLTGTLVSIQTKADVFPNMLIEAMLHEETPDVFDAIPLAVKLRQIQQVTVQYQALTSKQVQQPVDQSTVNTGTQQPQESALYQITNYLGGIFN